MVAFMSLTNDIIKLIKKLSCSWEFDTLVELLKKITYVLST